MQDQAEKLRTLARTIKDQVEAEIKGNTKKTKVIAVTSGKGGVGKTNFTINLALALKSYGQKVIVLDADLGLANVDVVLGISPNFTLYNVLKGEKSIKEIITTGPEDLQIIAGGSGILELANLRKWQVDNFINKLGELEGLADILIIDTGAGLSRNVMSFVLAADEVILVTTPEPTAITDAYGLVKAMTVKKREGVVHLVVNKVESAEEADVVASKLTIVAERFLKLHLEMLGFIVDDILVSKAVKSQEPFLLKYPKAEATQCIYKLAAHLTNNEYFDKRNNGVRSFFNKMAKIFQ